MVEDKKKFRMKESTVLLLIAIPFVLYIFAFYYVPLFGWGYAFVDYRPAFGINPFNHNFVGFANFTQVFNNRNEMIRVLRNTLAISGLGLLASPLPVLFAILLMEIRGKRFKRIIQTVTTFPNFISWIIIYGIALSFFSRTGVFSQFREFLGFPPQLIGPMGNVNIAWGFQTMLSVWRSLGWSAIIYCAAISGIDDSLYEAARLDGASKIQCIRHITIPGVAETYLVLLLLSIGNILTNGFEQFFVFDNNLVTERLMVLDLFVYRVGITQGQFSYATAIGMMRSLVGLTLLFTANRIAKKIRGESLI